MSYTPNALPNFATVAVNVSAGDTTLVSADATKQIIVHQVALFATTEATVRFEGGTGGTALTGIMPLYAKQGDSGDPGAATGALVLPYSQYGWFKTAANTLLNLEVTGGDVDGIIGYSLG